MALPVDVIVSTLSARTCSVKKVYDTSVRDGGPMTSDVMVQFATRAAISSHQKLPRLRRWSPGRAEEPSDIPSTRQGAGRP